MWQLLLADSKDLPARLVQREVLWLDVVTWDTRGARLATSARLRRVGDIVRVRCVDTHALGL